MGVAHHRTYASTGDTAFSTKADYLVAQLATCQDRAQIAGFTPGYLSAFPESFSQYAGDPYLDGAVDGFRVYSRALSATEVADLHATGQ